MEIGLVVPDRRICSPSFCDAFTIDTSRYSVLRYYVPRNMTNDPTLLILASVAEGEKHGYAMMDDIERFAGVRLGPGTLYGAITRLEERGLIRPIGSGGRRQPYALTTQGRVALQEQTSNLEQVLKTAIRRLRHA